MTVTDHQQPQREKWNFKTEKGTLQTSLRTGLSVLLNWVVKVHWKALESIPKRY